MSEPGTPKGVRGAESAPHLKLDPVTGAKTVGEAMKKMAAKGAGEADLQAMKAWLNDPRNINSATANEWKKTANFFPGAAGGERAPYLSWNGDRFNRNSGWLGGGWDSGDRAVLRG